jgi:hypothetical protein
MTTPFHTKKCLLIFIGIGFVLVLLSLITWRVARQLSLSRPPVWNGIEVGKTALSTAITLLGTPAETRTIKQYDLFRFADNKSWQVELWVNKSDAAQTVTGLIRTLVNPQKGEMLSAYVLKYGRPDEVSWSSYCELRTLLWPRQGIAVLANANISNAQWDTLIVSGVFLFEPVQLDEVVSQNFAILSSFGWSSVNLCISPYTDAPDYFPKDPYDWVHMPTPTK